ncbi:sulfite reductase [NADPH] flavoprotein alpha-component [Abditibacteriota bacterium]|nr:sulfite reductase [NADPH] flavoprotein alpha-component [Abditibacteriota bacterium]
MSFPTLPESAPFSADQRAWLNGFFAGLFNVGPGNAVAGGAALGMPAPAEEEEEFPWHDAALGMEERLGLAEGKPFPRVLMAAMAQLDCGSCGYLCQTYAEAIATGADKDLTKCSPGGKETKSKLKELVANAPRETGGVPTADVPAHPISDAARRLAGGPLYDKTNPFPSPILEVRALTRKDSAKDVRFVSFGLRGSGLQYEAGDALGVYPENDDELVEAIITELDSTGEEPTLTPENLVVPARMALSKGYVVNRVSDDFLVRLSDIAARDDEKERLRQLAEDDAENFLEGRDVLDILHEFPSARPREASHVGMLVSSLSALRPRLYSISSSPKAHPGEVHLTVGVVRYNRDGSDRGRKGVASSFLSERMGGHKVGVFVQPSHGFRPPSNPDAPLIMVGPGTGIAPFRAFVEERLACGHGGKNWLFFGDQRSDTDFLYQSEIEDWVGNGALKKLDLAWSRDGVQKVYVQHKMLENGAELWKWLDEGGHFTVCGDASRMAKDVDKALHQIVAQHGGKGEDGAREYIAQMAKEGRYARDVY